MRISVVLVSPKGSGNVGGVARAMGNFGLEDLRIVNPRCDLESAECKQMAMRSYALVRRAKLFRNFREAQADFTHSIALSGKPVTDGRQTSELFDFGARLDQIFSPEDHLGLIFGREETGLRLSELMICDWQISIPTSDRHPSINLTSAVAITLSVIFQRLKQVGNEVAKKPTSGKSELELRPDKETEERFFERLIDVLDRSKFLNPQNPEHIIEDLRAIFHRARLNQREMRIVFGVLSNIQLAMGLQIPRHSRGAAHLKSVK